MKYRGFTRQNFFENLDGFTLIELLVAITVAGVLMGALVAVLNPAGLFGRGRDSRRLSDLTTIQAALEAYYAENGAYPATGGVPFGLPWTPYLKNVPDDPQAPAQHYEYCAFGSDYEVCATMESAPLPSDCIGTISICSSAATKCCLTNPF